MLPLVIFLLHLIQLNQYRLDVHVRLLLSTSRRVYLYGAITYGTIFNYALVCVLGGFALITLWYLRFGVWGFMGEFTLLLNFFLIMVPIVIGFPLINLVEWLVAKWTRQGVLGHQIRRSN